MNDMELQTALESCILPFELWTHRAHLRMAYLYVRSRPLENAIADMRKSIKAYNSSQNVPDSPTRGYHETITVAFMHLVHDCLKKGPFQDSEVFCNQNPQLLNQKILMEYYSLGLLKSATAKAEFVAPDLASLPN